MDNIKTQIAKEIHNEFKANSFSGYCSYENLQEISEKAAERIVKKLINEPQWSLPDIKPENIKEVELPEETVIQFDGNKALSIEEVRRLSKDSEWYNSQVRQPIEEEWTYVVLDELKGGDIVRSEDSPNNRVCVWRRDGKGVIVGRDVINPFTDEDKILSRITPENEHKWEVLK